MANVFDVLVIGAGPGGYIAAIRSAQLGLSVACIDDWTDGQGKAAPGGTCTNVGCIPSKALLESSEHYEQAKTHFSEHGIGLKDLSIDVGKMVARKNGIVRQNNDGILYLFKKNKVRFFHAKASFDGKNDQGYDVRLSSGEVLAARHVIIATGSKPRSLQGVDFDEKIILSNTGALDLQYVPNKLVLIGSGVIGLEMGSVWRRLGADVTVLEASSQFLPFLDEQIAKEAFKAFRKQGLKVELGIKIQSVKKNANGVDVEFLEADGAQKKLSADAVIVSIGRVPNTEGLNLDAVGVTLDARGTIVVDGLCHTNAPNVWAIGDVVRGPMLAHKAEEEGVAVAERIVGQHGHVNYDAIPGVIYTAPEIAWVGQTEQQLKEQNIAYKVGTFPFAANGRARAMGQSEGLVKILADARTDEVLGVHMLGPMVSELITEAVMALEFKASSEDIARICHAHPSLAEAMKEAALGVDNRMLNF